MDILILATDIVEKLILLALIGLSIWSISIIFEKRKFFKTQSPQGFADKLQAEFKALNLQTANSIEIKTQAYIRTLRPTLEKGLTPLATLGSNAPFIGLFGTVLGIIRAFAYLGSQSGSTAVMNGVSQALYATAMGLLVAIPAVIAFNIFAKKSKELIAGIESFKDEYIEKSGILKKE